MRHLSPVNITVVPSTSRQPEVQEYNNEAQDSDDPLSSSSHEIFVPQGLEAKVVKHVKKTKKRKSEPIVRLTNDESENEEENYEKRAKKSRKSEPVTRKKPTDEYEEDVGHNESKCVGSV